MSVKIKYNKNFDKFKNDPAAFADQFPCPVCGTTSKRIAEKKFHCPKCDGDFTIDPEYITGSDSTT